MKVIPTEKQFANYTKAQMADVFAQMTKLVSKQESSIKDLDSKLNDCHSLRLENESSANTWHSNWKEAEEAGTKALARVEELEKAFEAIPPFDPDPEDGEPFELPDYPDEVTQVKKLGELVSLFIGEYDLEQPLKRSVLVVLKGYLRKLKPRQ